MKEIEFKFKGNRRYVHGPDIFYAICDHITEIENKVPTSVKLVSKHLSEKQLFFKDEILDNLAIQSTADYTIGNEKKRLYSYESSDEVINSIDYDEPDIVNNASFSGFVGTIVNYSRYNVAEISVAILKEICNRTITDTVKWVFVGLELETKTNKNTTEEIKIELIKHLGTKMVVSNIYIDSIKVGQLKFSSIAK
ncbi:MAG: hypothetical protein JJ895_02525 [Balneolaceae bacterium]|nr:hypothetical protein [Balneolaceae bacterium]